MRYLILIAGAMLCAGAGISQAQAFNQWKIGAGGLTSATGMESYHMGVGGSGALSLERAMGAAESRIGIRGNYLNYEPQDDALVGSADFQEYGVGLEALFGPVGAFFEPKAGGHVGYQRIDGGAAENDVLDVGADVLATFKLTPRVDFQAQVSPVWLIDEGEADYQTRGSVGVQIGLNPGA